MMTVMMAMIITSGIHVESCDDRNGYDDDHADQDDDHDG